MGHPTSESARVTGIHSEVDRLGNHPELQPQVRTLPLLVGDDLLRGGLHHRRGEAPPRPRSPSSPSRSSCSPAASRCCARHLRAGGVRHLAGAAHVHGDQRRRCVDDEVCEKMRKADIKMVSLSLDGSTAGDPRRLPRSARAPSTAWCAPPRSSGSTARSSSINSSFTKRNQARHRRHVQARQVPRRHRLVHVHDRPHRPRRGDHERADLQGGLRGDPRVALPAGEAGGRDPHAPHLRPALLPDRAAEGEGGGGEVRAPLAHLLHRRRQGVHRRPDHLPHRLLRQRQALLLLPRAPPAT